MNNHPLIVTCLTKSAGEYHVTQCPVESHEDIPLTNLFPLHKLFTGSTSPIKNQSTVLSFLANRYFINKTQDIELILLIPFLTPTSSTPDFLYPKTSES